MYMASNDDDFDDDKPADSRRSIAQALLSKYLWKSLDILFLKAATEIEHFKPSQEDLKVTVKPKIITNETAKSTNSQDVDEKVQAHGSCSSGIKLLSYSQDCRQTSGHVQRGC